MKSFVECADDFYTTDQIFFKTRSDYVVQGISLKTTKIVLVEFGRVVDLDYVKKKFNRTLVFVVPCNFDLEVGDDKKVKLSLLTNTALAQLTVNQHAIVDVSKMLLLEGKRGKDENAGVPPLVEDFKNFVNTLTDEEVKAELFDVNIDLPEYAIIDKRLYIINEPDKIINRMIIFGKFSHRNRDKDSISIYHFSENLYDMNEHILSRYIFIFDNAIQVCANFDDNATVIVDKDTVFSVPLRNSTHKKYNIAEVRRAFGRKSFLELMTGK